MKVLQNLCEGSAWGVVPLSVDAMLLWESGIKARKG